ncbi:MAG: hypothetical protein WC186_09645 [Bacteroidales bacterium]
MDEIDVSNIEVKTAYLDADKTHCKLNGLLCRDGDCRKCNFVIDGSLMLVLDTVCHELAHIKYLLGDEEEPKCGCGCGSDCEEEH